MQTFFGEACNMNANSDGGKVTQDPSCQTRSLNQDPYNLRAEALALEECMRSANGACRTWSEQEMLCCFGGAEIPGTPDGMYEDSQGMLTCVQVVRMPLLPEMSRVEVAATIYHTVLTKLVKSQVWLKSSRILPHEFVVFCWLPGFSIHRKRTQQAQALVLQVRGQGWPFRLQFAVPDDPRALFPERFATNCNSRAYRFSEADLSQFNVLDFEDDDDAMEWDVFAFEEEAEDELMVEDHPAPQDDEDDLFGDPEMDALFEEERIDDDQHNHHSLNAVIFSCLQDIPCCIQ